ncbi:MAG: competence protein ComEA [Thermoleophilaceae bacterium]|nr:competence protein ComEA [Thermoleophilaceae bacterium]
MLEQPRSTIAIWVVAAAVAVFAAVRLLGGGGGAEAPPVSVDGAVPSGPGAHRQAPAPDELYVHVVGAVRRPGLIRLPDGTRVARALERAGGPTGHADLTLVNLAARVQDGQQIVVPAAGAAAPSGAGSGGPAAPAGKVHLSSATAQQLDEVDGIGPTLAERIVEYRGAHGFGSLDDLAQVDGIGEKRLATLRDALQP